MSHLDAFERPCFAGFFAKQIRVAVAIQGNAFSDGIAPFASVYVNVIYFV